MKCKLFFWSPTLPRNSFHLAFVACLIVSLPALACINETGTNHRGERIAPMNHAGKNLKPYLLGPTTPAALATWAGRVVEIARTKPSFDSLNNLAAAQIRLGKLDEALSLLQSQERKYPGRYETASNMGTAYELKGRNEDALKWIREGMKRNPDDHYGTEWLHVHILNAKLRRIAKPEAGRSILNLDFGNNELPRRPTRFPTGNAGKQLSLVSVAHALRYQLIERIEFVAAPDSTVAGLLLDWSNLELLAGSVESADVLYDAAIRYGSKEGRIIALRKTQVASILAAARTKPALAQGRCELCEPPEAAGDKK
jgi:tetratricopeptide (TPR) repeat protein